MIVINALLNAVTKAGYQRNKHVFVGNFAPLGGLQVYRNSDGGPIESLLSDERAHHQPCTIP